MTSIEMGIATAALLLFAGIFFELSAISLTMKRIADALDRANPKPVDVAPSDADGRLRRKP